MLKILVATLVATVVLGAFLFLNADGHPVYLVRAKLYSHNPNFPDSPGFEVNYRRVQHKALFQNWIHGWPIAGLLRVGVLPAAYNGELLKRSGNGGPFAVTSRWPFDNVPWYYTNYPALAVNALIMAIVTVHAFFSTRRMLASRFRLSISWLLAILFIAAVISAFREILFVKLDWQERTAVVVAVTATLATTIRFILGSIRIVRNRLQRPANELVDELNWTSR